MKRVALAVGIWAVMAAPAPAVAGETVNGLRRDGWVVVEKREQIERRPGLAPYESLIRVVLVTTYLMEKDGRRKRCTLAYDSQRDAFEEACRDDE